MGLIIKDILKIGENRLTQAGCMDPKLDAEILFCHQMGMTKMQLFINWSEELSDERCENYFNIIEVRAQGMPLQYITGHQEFMGMNFKVTPDVLIPRQDTENLVELAVDRIRSDGRRHAKVLDLCTGSGAIAVSLERVLATGKNFAGTAAVSGGAAVAAGGAVSGGAAAGAVSGGAAAGLAESHTVGELREARQSGAYSAASTGGRAIGGGRIEGGAMTQFVEKSETGKKAAAFDVSMTASDVSESALNVARENARANGAKVDFVRGDLFTPFKKKIGPNKKFDFIITNPPYIPSGVIPTLQTEVKDHEPMLALDGGHDGLDFYRRIIAEAPSFLREGGVLMMEIGHDQADAIRMLTGINGAAGDFGSAVDSAAGDFAAGSAAAAAAEKSAAKESKKKKRDQGDHFTTLEIIKDYAGHDRIAVLGL